MGTHRPSVNLMEVLEDRGYGATGPRKTVARLLMRQHKGFTVEALSEELPLLGKATIHRTIKLFLKTGVVCKFPFMDGPPLYFLTRVNHRHHHSVCVLCGAVGEFSAAKIDQSIEAITADI